MTSNVPKPKILILNRDHKIPINALEKHLEGRADLLTENRWDEDIIFKESPDLLVFTDNSMYEAAQCVEAARAKKIPTLLLQDGILEWRCQYENPLFGKGGGGPQHQPVLTDKIACIGNQSARQIASWGNPGKVEITGMMRLDEILENGNFRPVSRPGRTVLIMSAQKPYFNESQKEAIVKSLNNLRQSLMEMSSVRIIWRLTRDLTGILGVKNGLEGTLDDSLLAMIEAADAVVSTPSTAGLEAMLLGRPLAFVDYTNSPRFVPTVWNITAAEHVKPVMVSMLEPDAAHMAFQSDILQDVLQTAEPASKRTAELMIRMAGKGKLCRESGQPLDFSAPILEQTPIFVSYLPSLARLYPEAEVFSDAAPNRLHGLLARAQKENEALHRQLRSRSLGYWIDLGGRYLVKAIKKKRGER